MNRADRQATRLIKIFLIFVALEPVFSTILQGVLIHLFPGLNTLVLFHLTRATWIRTLYSGVALGLIMSFLIARVRSIEEGIKAAKDTILAEKDKAVKASQAKTDLLNLFSHELKTPMTSMLLNIQFIQKGIDDPVKVRQIIANIGRSINLLNILIDGMLEQVRYESGKPHLTITMVHFEKLIQDSLTIIGPIAEEKGLEVVADIHDGTLLRTDAGKLSLIVNNLLSNAVKFTDRGKITVTTHIDENGATLEVADTGRGIAEKDFEKLFQPFSRLEILSHKKTPGLGLGLSICRNIAHILGGWIKVESQVGVGTKFTVYIPNS